MPHIFFIFLKKIKIFEIKKWEKSFVEGTPPPPPPFQFASEIADLIKGIESNTEVN